ncbi:MAG TPA: glycine cleavage system aminomethyltransferase GcvT, partial [Acidimicrobiales bacterium]|nr:glycine cleavage system aminomethyltransferase GcvT [Acidimicrobiales bacterium]
MDLKRSPLHADHVALGARLTEFGGWEMPLSYQHGTIAEHLACRSDAVMFDVSHLGTVRVEGPGCVALLQANFTNDLGKITPGKAQYTHLLDARDASVVDDIIVWWVDQDRFDVMPNASNTERVQSVIGGSDITSNRAIIAIQGPKARERVGRLFPEVASVPHFGVSKFEFMGAPCIVAGTGYTGEDGFECAVDSQVASEFWRAIISSGVLPAGLGARDTLRLEAALPLHSHELGPGITPLQAGLSWVVSWDKGDFRGRDALDAERRRGVARRLRALCSSGRRPPHPGDSIVTDDISVGLVTSGNYSPVLARGIALGFVPPDLVIGTKVEIETRGVRT